MGGSNGAVVAAVAACLGAGVGAVAGGMVAEILMDNWVGRWYVTLVGTSLMSAFVLSRLSEARNLARFMTALHAMPIHATQGLGNAR